MHEWPVRKLLTLVLGFQLLVIAILGLSSAGHDVTGLRQIVVFIYLTFIPGILILRILGIRDLGLLKSTLFAVGLSLGSLMLLGFLLNSILPHISVAEPISVLPLTVAFSVFVLILSAITVLNHRRFQPSETSFGFDRQVHLAPLLLIILLMFLSVLGALMVSFWEDSTLLLILLPVLASVVVLAVFNKFIPVSMYGLLLAAIAVSLMYQMTLMSPFLTGGSDIHGEFYYQQSVVSNSHWDSTIDSNFNSVLSVTLIGPTYSILMGIGGIWVLKVIFPLIFALGVLGLYEVFRSQFGSRIAFFAGFVFISVIPVSSITALPRQQMAEFFLVLILLLMIEKGMSQLNKSILAIVFSLSLIVTHYATATLCAGLFLAGFLQLILWKQRQISDQWGKMRQKLKLGVVSLRGHLPELDRPLLDGMFILIFFAVLLAWYSYISSGSVMTTWVVRAQETLHGISHASSMQGKENEVGTSVGLDFGSASVLGKSFRLLQYALQACIVIGLLRSLLAFRGFKLSPEFLTVANAALALLVASVALPHFAASLNVNRVYQISLLFLSPFCIVGVATIWGWIREGAMTMFHRLGQFKSAPSESWESHYAMGSVLLRVISLLLLISYFLFNTGFVFEASKSNQTLGKPDIPASIVLSSKRIDGFYHNKQEYSAADWMLDRKMPLSAETPIYADLFGSLSLVDDFGWEPVRQISDSQRDILNVAAVFWRTRNIDKGELAAMNSKRVAEHHDLNEFTAFRDAPTTRDKIYDNGGAYVFTPR